MLNDLEIDIKIAEALGYTMSPSPFYDDLDENKIYYCFSDDDYVETKLNLIEFTFDKWTQYEFSPLTNVNDAIRSIEHIGKSYKIYKLSSGYKCFILNGDGQDNFAEAHTLEMAICLSILTAMNITINMDEN